ncbi:MAG: ribbon-helix-helix domain-containing protein [Candidatus Bathyarchaeia archaeon]
MNRRIGIRINQTERQQLEALIKAGKFKTITEIIRTALKQFLETQVQAS